MLIYLLYYVFIIILYFTIQEFKQKENIDPSLASQDVAGGRRESRGFVFTVFGALILIIGLRHPTMGTDLVGYLPSFDSLGKLSWKEIFKLDSYLNYEKGYIIFNKLISTISKNRQVFLFCCACCSILPLALFIYKNSRNALTSLLVYLGLPVFLTVYSALRQAIAVAITLCAFEYIKKKRLIPFIITIAIASLFHSSAVIALVAYPIYHFKPKKLIRQLSVILLPIIWLLQKPLFEVILKLLDSEKLPDNNNGIGLFLVFFCIYIFSLIIGDNQNSTTNGTRNLFWFACALQAMAGQYQLVLRVTYYFMVYLIILLPELFFDMKKTIKNKGERWAIKMIIMLGFIVFGLYLIKGGSGWAMSAPYRFFWQV